jgi:hypothetical protein
MLTFPDFYKPFHIYTDASDKLRKSTRRRACALGRAWHCFRYKNIDHRLKCEHECALLRLPRVVAPMVIFH